MAKCALAKNDTVYSFGPIIHNPQAVNRLTERGLKVVKDVDRAKTGTLLVPSHGMTPSLLGRARKRNISIVDATCPKVINSQKLAKALSDKGFFVVIVGERNHPEVKSLKGFAKDSVVIENKADAVRFSTKNRNIGIIVQTTQSEVNFFTILSELVKKNFEKIEILNTLCRDTLRRQKEAGDLARNSDVVFVVGGKESANTKRLFEICKKFTKAYHVQTGVDIKKELLNGAKRICIVSGTSTPNWIISSVAKKIESFI